MEKQNNHTDEIDLFAILSVYWQQRKNIVKAMILAGIVAFILNLLTPSTYTSETIFVAQGAKSTTGRLESLQSLLGVSTDNVSGDISSKLYPKLIESYPFLNKMMYSKIRISPQDEEITYAQYTEKYPQQKPIALLKKYTIGLPSLVFRLFSSSGKSSQAESFSSDIYKLTAQESRVYAIIKENIAFDADEKQGVVTLKYTESSGWIAAQMLKNAEQILQKTITELKIQKAKEKMDFIQKRYEEAKVSFERIQMERAKYQDTNREQILSQTQAKRTRLDTEYNLAFGVYLDLSKSLESQRIQLKEDTPVFTIIQPVSVPLGKSNIGLIKYLFFGVMAGFCMMIGLITLKLILNFLKENIEMKS